MIYRKLGRTGVDVGIIGLGAEYLEHEPEKTVVSVVHEAVDSGVNYIDLFLASPGVRDNIGKALINKRQKVMVAGHLGAVMRNGQYSRSRDNDESLTYFDDLLTRLRTDYIDVLMLHYVDKQDDYERVFDHEGPLGVALRLKKEGKARFIGMSSHNVPTSLRAVDSGYIDVLMFSINPAFDMLPEEMPEISKRVILYHQSPAAVNKTFTARQALYHACAVQNVALVAMKPYAAGVLFRDNPSSIILTPVQCLSYALSQPAVCTAVPGCHTVAEVQGALAFLKATEEEKDFSAIQRNPMWKVRGNCMYCNHCLPCPAHIDIGQTIRLFEMATRDLTDAVHAAYAAMPTRASDCTQCGACERRCPFGVPVMDKMRQAVAQFA